MFQILWLTLCISVLQARSTPERASIQGTVVRAGAVQGAPRVELGNARIELKPGNQTSFTTANGVFSFRNLAPGQYTVFVRRDGYILQEDPGHGITSSGITITLAAGQVLKDLTLPMVQAPVITGKVFDPHGDPLAAALIRAYRRQYTPYGTQLRIASKGMTNDLGEFRLFGLNFADYFVSAGYGDRDRAAAVGKVQLSANVSRADDGFATVFYDGGNDLSFAKPAHVAPGADPVALNIYLSDTARFKIRGQASRSEGVKILFAPKGSDLREADRSTGVGANGEFEINGVPPGSYVVLATDDTSYTSDVVPFTVTDSDIEGVRLPLMRTMSVRGTVSLERGLGVNLPGIHISLLSGIHITLIRSSAEFDEETEVLTAANGDFGFENVAPLAEYDVALDQLPPGTYVKSIYSGSSSLLEGKSRFQNNAGIRIVLASAPDTLDVRVAKASGAAGVQVVLIPEANLRRRADRYITGFTDESGSLRLTAVPPGNYTAYAFEHLESGAYYVLGYNRTLAEKLKDRSMSIVIGENGNKSIQLSVIPATETAGWQ